MNLRDFNYELPPEKIARYPARERDLSKLLVYRDGKITTDIFRNADRYIPADSLLVFNNARVIRARILFRKPTGASVEILCLEPLSPAGYSQSFGSRDPVEWKCIVGNLRKWKSGAISTTYISDGAAYELNAVRIAEEGEAWRIRFEWGSSGLSFAEVIELAGVMPLPPYINRNAGPEDLVRYQTVYASISGSVAAPTAGLHFTDIVLGRLGTAGVRSAEITLHVGAGTFKPVKSDKITDHLMHSEHFSVTIETIGLLRMNLGNIIAVGTTSVRTLESLYWLGVKILNRSIAAGAGPRLDQWEAYTLQQEISASDSLDAITEYMRKGQLSRLDALTGIMIVPGYRFRMTDGMITNFHQPGSSLLMLIAAWLNESWREIYDYALRNDFRFLSYGDASLLFRE